MPSIFPNDLTPQRRYIVSQFVGAVRDRKLSSTDLQFILVHFRETEASFEFWEWGSAVAHVRRNQGWLWESAVAIWATHVYYSNLDYLNIQIDPLPIDIFHTVRHYLENTSESNLRAEFDDLFTSGAPRTELLATLDHLYAVPKKNQRERKAFYHLMSKGGITDEDRAMIRRIIVAVEDYALSIPPSPLSDVINALEEGLRRQGALTGSFSSADRDYLQLHCLVAFHDTLVDIRSDAFKQLTGVEMGDVQPMAFVSCFEDVVTLDLGFFKIEDGHIEPASILSPMRNLAGGRIERYYYPFLASELPVRDFMLECDNNIRLSLYNHPLRVVPHENRHVIIAEERNSTRYPTTRTRNENNKS